MSDFATLVLNADTTGLVKGETALDSIVSAAGRAQNAAKSVSGGFKETSRAAEFFTKSARSSAQAFQGFDKARDAVNKLRASVDPAFASAMKFSNAVDQLDAAYDSGVVSAREYNQTLQLLSSSLLGTETAAQSVTTSMQSQINSITGVTTANNSLASSSAEVFQAFDRLENSVDQLRRSYDPLYANSKKYESAVRTLDAALDAGVISGQQHTRMLEQAGRSMLTVSSQGSKLSATMGGVQGNIGNMTAQLNDIGVMAVSGQSPLLLMFQQGTQVTQAFDSMGDAAKTTGQRVRVMRDAFARALSPANLLVMGIIGGTVLLAQWAASALGAADETRTFADATSDLESSMGALRDSTSNLESSLVDLQDEFGENSRKARELFTVLNDINLVRALQGQDELVERLSDRFITLRRSLAGLDGGGAGAALGQSENVRRIADDFGVGVEQARLLSEALAEIENATTLVGRNAAMQGFLQTIRDTRDSAGEIPPELLKIAEDLGKAVVKGLKLEDAADNSADSTRRLASEASNAANAFLRAGDNARGMAQALSSLSVPFESALDELNFEMSVAGMDAADRLVATRVRRLEEAMRSASEETFGFDYGLTDEQRQQLSQFEQQIRSAAPSLTEVSTSAGSASRSVQELSLAASTAESIINGVRKESLTYSEVLGELNARLRDGKITNEEYALSVEKAREDLIKASEGTKFWEKQNQSLKDGLLDSIVAGESLADTFNNVGKAIQRAALEAALFGSGPFGGDGDGLLGGFLDTVFSSKGNVVQRGEVVPFARGGVVSQPTAFPMPSGKTGVMGEAGDEAIMPLTRIRGDLGVRAVSDKGDSSSNNDGPATVRVLLSVPAGVTVEETRQIAGSVSVQVMEEGLSQYDRSTLPKSVDRISNDPRRVG